MSQVRLEDLKLAPVAIQYLRDVKGWSYEDIAQRLKCNRSTVYRAHAEGTQPMRHTAERLEKLAVRLWKNRNKQRAA